MKAQMEREGSFLVSTPRKIAENIQRRVSKLSLAMSDMPMGTVESVGQKIRIHKNCAPYIIRFHLPFRNTELPVQALRISQKSLDSPLLVSIKYFIFPIW